MQVSNEIPDTVLVTQICVLEPSGTDERSPRRSCLSRSSEWQLPSAARSNLKLTTLLVTTRARMSSTIPRSNSVSPSDIGHGIENGSGRVEPAAREIQARSKGARRLA